MKPQYIHQAKTSSASHTHGKGKVGRALGLIGCETTGNWQVGSRKGEYRPVSTDLETGAEVQ